MSPDRWSRVKEIFDSIADEPASRHMALVHAACDGDLALEAEVLRLLGAVPALSDFLEAGASNLFGELLEQPSSSPAFVVGAVLARRFEIRSYINRGGMGEVYEAWDSQLNQAVALKTILPHISANPAVIERFKQEVRLAREVSHPNICRVHELFCEEPAEGPPIWFLSMELLRGTTLLAHIREHGPLLRTAAEHLAVAMLSGLQAAHTRGLVHRDFKSGNVMLLDMPGSPVRAVITDFGLAIMNSPGVTNGSDLIARGTPGYMSPEQKRGEVVGPAADQYAFGVVLWEMMTGQTPPATGNLSIDSRNIAYPKTWLRVIQRCTAPAPDDRFPDMAAVRSSLLPAPVRTRMIWVEAAAILLAAGLGLLLWKRHARVPPVACVICNTVQITPDVDKSETPSLSQDGRFVAYSSDRAEPGNLDIFVQKLPSGPVIRLTRDGARDTVPSISPDGSQVAFRSERDGGGIYLASTQAPEQSPRLLIRGGRDPKFSPDGKSLLYWTGDPDSSTPSGRAFLLPLAGGAPQLVAAQFQDARYPVWNSNGRAILLTGCLAPGLLPDCLDWWIASASTGTVAPTHAFFSLRAKNFLPGRLNSLEWRGNQLVYSSMNTSGRLNLAEISLPPSDPHAIGQPRWLLPSDSGELDPSISGGGSIAFTRITGALHIWKMDGLLEKKQLSLEKVTEDPEVDGQPFVAEGGRYLVFTRGRSAQRVVVLRDLQSGQERVVWNQGLSAQSPIVDRDGVWLAFQQAEPTGRSAVYAGRIGTSMKRICEDCSAPFGWFAHDHMFFFRSGLKALSLADPRTGQQQPVLSETEAMLGDASWSAATSNLVLVASSPARKRIEVVHLNSIDLHPQRSVFMPEEPGTPLHPRWYGNGTGIVYTSNRDGFMCLYRRRFDVAKQRFGEPIVAAHIHNQRASIDEVLPRVLNLSTDGDSLFLNLGEQSSTIQVGTLAQVH
ncbi:serine/threonine-protein kinase [Terriglobus aquaticus]|uniref:Serine/threonine-protein kinase n=1 Tax=Terriglobus aquaticus TaxID=940139 RepID=A0ABW9KH25_9BACT|nr:serine/threonine-protein kinase [Terriglobus aquaticus]